MTGFCMGGEFDRGPLLRRLFLMAPLVHLSAIFVSSHFIYFLFDPEVLLGGVFGVSQLLFLISLPAYIFTLSKLTSGYSFHALIGNFKSNVVSDIKVFCVLLFSFFGYLVVILSPWVKEYPSINFKEASSISLIALYAFYFLPTYLFLSFVAGLQPRK